MYKATIIVLMLTSLLSKSFSFASKNDTTKEEERVLFFIYNCQFMEAKEEINNLKKKNSSSLIWEFYQTLIEWRQVVVQLKVNFSLNPELSKKVEISLLKLQEKYEIEINKNPQDIGTLFYAGAVNGYLGIYYAGIKDKPMDALSVGKKGLDYHENILKKEPEFYDAYYSLGIYNYYASRVPWFVKPFLFIFGRLGSETDALKYFELVKEKGNLAKYEATEYLAEFYAEKKMMDSAKSYYQILMNDFPSGRIVYYLILGNWYNRYNQIEEATQLFHEAINDCNTVPFTTDNSKYLIQLYLNYGYYLEKASRYEEAIQVYQSVIDKQKGYTEWLQYHIGLDYEKMGKYKEALVIYKEIHGIELSPKGYSEVLNKIKLLESRK